MPSFKQITESQWVKGEYAPMAILPIAWRKLGNRLKATFSKYDVDGLGKARGAMFITDSGVQFIIEHLLEAGTAEPYTTIQGHVRVVNGQLTPFVTDDLEAILECTGIESTELTWIHGSIAFKEHEVWRQDDNGNKFLMKKLPCRADARKMVAKFTKRGHKQTYWEQKAK